MGQRLSACFGATRDERGTREMRRLRACSEQEHCTQPPSSLFAPITAETLRYCRAPFRRAGDAHRSCTPVRHAIVVNAACGTGDMTKPTTTHVLCMLFCRARALPPSSKTKNLWSCQTLALKPALQPQRSSIRASRTQTCHQGARQWQQAVI